MVYDHIILEAIDQLRIRKARPDFHRITMFLMRNFSISPSEVKLALERCIQKEIVIKVEYKGSISYRNAARSRKYQLKHANLTSNTFIDTDDSPSPLNTGPSKKFKALLVNAFTELIVEEPDYLEDGVPGDELIGKILSKDTVRSYTKQYLSVLIEKLTGNGVLQKRRENGNYLLGPNLHHEIDKSSKESKQVKINAKKGVKKLGRKPKPKMELNENSSTTTHKSNNNVRVGSRRKVRAKKVFDPSDYNRSPKKRNRQPLTSKAIQERSFTKYKENDIDMETTAPSSNREGGVCSVCHNKKAVKDHLVSCGECNNKAHFGCLNGDDMMLKMNPDNTWYCPHCKTCCVCYETSDAGVLMVCSLCADAYHANCHEPRIMDNIKDGKKWFCNNCEMSEQLQVAQIYPDVPKSNVIKHEAIEELEVKEELLSSSESDDDCSKDSIPQTQTPPISTPQTTRSLEASPKAEHEHYNGFHNFDVESQLKIDPSIPDATHWTSEDVYQYFVQYFPNEAKVFKEQEIDGRSLLLMKRYDVLTSLKLKLGPALNIYRHVVKLQFRRDDPKLYWL